MGNFTAGRTSALLLAAVVAGWSGAAVAQKEQSAWVKLCERTQVTVRDKSNQPAQAPREVCLTHHERLDGNTGQVIVSAALRQIEGETKQTLMVMVPLGTAQAPGLRVAFYDAAQWAKIQRNEKFDDSHLKPLKMQFSFCHASGCTAEIESNPEIIDELRTKVGLMVLAINGQGKVVAFPVPLAGFKAALDGPPIDNVAYSKARKALMEQIAERQREKAKGSGNSTTAAAAPTAAPTSTPTASYNLGRRVALVIGNSRYSSATSLVNPPNDARAIAAKFRSLGFAEVRERHNLSLAEFNAELKTFGDMAAGSDWAVIYFAGHGVQVDGVSYVLPVDVVLNRATHINDEAVPLDRLLQKVGDARLLKLVILDACRDNPFMSRLVRAGGSRSLGRGLAAVEPSGGVLVAYAARDGQIAADGHGTNSPFTAALLKHLDEPGLEIGLLFRRVRDTVLGSTKRSQEPFVYGSLPGEPYFFRTTVR